MAAVVSGGTRMSMVANCQAVRVRAPLNAPVANGSKTPTSRSASHWKRSFSTIWMDMSTSGPRSGCSCSSRNPCAESTHATAAASAPSAGSPVKRAERSPPVARARPGSSSRLRRSAAQKPISVESACSSSASAAAAQTKTPPVMPQEVVAGGGRAHRAAARATFAAVERMNFPRGEASGTIGRKKEAKKRGSGAASNQARPSLASASRCAQPARKRFNGTRHDE